MKNRQKCKHFAILRIFVEKDFAILRIFGKKDLRISACFCKINLRISAFFDKIICVYRRKSLPLQRKQIFVLNYGV